MLPPTNFDVPSSSVHESAVANADLRIGSGFSSLSGRKLGIRSNRSSYSSFSHRSKHQEGPMLVKNMEKRDVELQTSLLSNTKCDTRPRSYGKPSVNADRFQVCVGRYTSEAYPLDHLSDVDRHRGYTLAGPCDLKASLEREISMIDPGDET